VTGTTVAWVDSVGQVGAERAECLAAILADYSDAQLDLIVGSTTG
jgi:hypothetical protein